MACDIPHLCTIRSAVSFDTMHSGESSWEVFAKTSWEVAKKKKKKKTTLRVMLYIFPTREKHTAVNVSANMQTVTGEKREKKSSKTG